MLYGYVHAYAYSGWHTLVEIKMFLTGLWGAQAHVARMVLFARDCGPWQARDGVERACESGSRELMCYKC